MNPMQEPLLRIQFVIDCLLMYWQENPKASDTLEGICCWWMKYPEMETELVYDALQMLCQKGLVQSVQAADGRIRYRLNQKQ